MAPPRVIALAVALAPAAAFSDRGISAAAALAPLPMDPRGLPPRHPDISSYARRQLGDAGDAVLADLGQLAVEAASVEEGEERSARLHGLVGKVEEFLDVVPGASPRQDVARSLLRRIPARSRLRFVRDLEAVALGVVDFADGGTAPRVRAFIDAMRASLRAEDVALARLGLDEAQEQELRALRRLAVAASAADGAGRGARFQALAARARAALRPLRLGSASMRQDAARFLLKDIPMDRREAFMEDLLQQLADSEPGLAELLSSVDEAIALARAAQARMMESNIGGLGVYLAEELREVAGEAWSSEEGERQHRFWEVIMKLEEFLISVPPNAICSRPGRPEDVASFLLEQVPSAARGAFVEELRGWYTHEVAFLDQVLVPCFVELLDAMRAASGAG